MFPVFLWEGEEDPPVYPPPLGRRNLSNPLEGEGRWSGCAASECPPLLIVGESGGVFSFLVFFNAFCQGEGGM
jgi:hypothetical protein